MNPKTLSIATIALCTAVLAGLAGAELTVVGRFAVNDYVGMDYDREPVSSFDVSFPDPVPASAIRLSPGPWQVEVLEGTPQAVRKARVWTHVSFPFIEQTERTRRDGQDVTRTVRRPAPGKDRHKIYTVLVDETPVDDSADDSGKSGTKTNFRVERLKKGGPLQLAAVGNGLIRAVMPVGGATFDTPLSALSVPGPVVRIQRDGGEWIGDGYLDSMRRVESVDVRTQQGPIFWQSTIVYRFEGGKTYRVRARLYANKPYVQLVEDFDLGGASRFVFNYQDWFADAFFRTGDQRLAGWESITSGNPCGDFVTIAGQKALARMVIWTQFNYFGGKQETIGLKAPDRKALAGAYVAAVAKYKRDSQRYAKAKAEYDQAVTRYEQQLAAYKEDPKQFRRPPKAPRRFRGRQPIEPERAQWERTTYTLGGASIPASNVVTPGGDATAVGAFYIRPDRWTRAKVNHVDLYMRPEVPAKPGQDIVEARMTRGQVGLDGAVQRIAMEAWLVDGHREWAIFAVRAGDDTWMAKAHVQEGVWPLDRLIRLPLVWNSDGSEVALENTAPGDGGAGGDAQTVLKGTRGRSGLQHYNGSNGNIRGAAPPREGFDGKVQQTRANPSVNNDLAGLALKAYMASDDSAYPSVRAMLPWTDPEAINPFYQGMENMNFNADLYRYVVTQGVRLAKMGHPQYERFLRHGEKSFDMALNRYVYPGSGCWEESHGYAGHTLKVVGPLARALANTKGYKNFLEDIRLARMIEFFLYVHSPKDAEFGNRIVPPIGDHGLKRSGPADRLSGNVKLFEESKDPEIRRIVRNVYWLIREDGGGVPDGIQQARPDLTSRWLRGYGTVMRSRQADGTQQVMLTLDRALWRGKNEDKRSYEPLELTLTKLPDGSWASQVSGTSRTYNRADHQGTLEVQANPTDGKIVLKLNMTIGSDRWVKGGKATYTVTLDKELAGGTFAGTYNDEAVAGKAAVDVVGGMDESYAVLRAGQSWGHHHMDKGSLWFWGRNVHFFGDCSWGAPPGGTYGNPFKQGPASGTQIELKGITNWTLPCKYAAPYIADEQYAHGYDYALARCLYPFNPRLDLSKSTPVALTNGYDRQVLFVHPDVLIVRDNVRTACDTVWRLHSYQKETTKVRGNTATLVSKHGVTGELTLAYPDGVKLTAWGSYPKVNPWSGQPHGDSGKPFNSLMLEWDMPPATDVTWVFGVHGERQEAPKVQRLDEKGRVTRVVLADGTEILALLADEPFTYTSDRVTFEGTVGLVIRRDGKVKVHPIRARTLKAE